MRNNNKRIKRKVRNSYIISTVSIALVLFLLSAVGYLTLNALSATRKMKESVAMYVMLDKETGNPERRALEKELQAMPSIREVTYVSKEMAAKEFKEYVGSDFEEFLKQNPLPDSFEIRITADSSNKEAVEALEELLISKEEVDEVVYHKNVIEQVVSNINKFNLILLFFGGTLLVISLILLNNTIRVSIFAKRYIINTMKLVGATRWFILRPFVWSAVKQGLYAAFFASIMFIAIVAGLNDALPDVTFIIDTEYLLLIIGAMFVSGVLISLTFTVFAVNKFVKMHTNGIYLF